MSGHGYVMGDGMMDDRVEQLLSGQYFKKYQEAMYSEITDKFNMTLMEVRVLLFFDNHGSSNTAKDLVRIFHYTKSNVSKAIDSLLLRGYLKKQYDDQDRRYIHLTVQPEAADVLEMARQCQKDMFQSVFRGISEEELQIVQKVAQKIHQNISEAMQ